MSIEAIANALKATLGKKFPNRVTLFDFPALGSDLDQQAIIIDFGGMNEVQVINYGNTEHLMGWLLNCTLYTKGETTEPAEVHALVVKGVDKIVDIVAEYPHLGLASSVVREAKVVNVDEVIVGSIETGMEETMSVVVTVQIQEDRTIVPAE